MPIFFDDMKFPTPSAYLDDTIEAGVSAGSMVVVVFDNDDERSELLREQASTRGGIYLICDTWKSDKRFLIALTDRVCVSQTGTAHEILDRLIDTLKANPRPLFLDNAERLKPGMFSDIRTIYDQADVLIVMASGSTKLIDQTDDRKRGGQFYSRRVRRDIDKEMRNDRESIGKPIEGEGIIGKVGLDESE